MHARVVLGVGKGVLFREVSSVQECPYIEREREVPLYGFRSFSPFVVVKLHRVLITPKIKVKLFCVM